MPQDTTTSQPVRTLWTSLPGRAVAASAIVKGAMWVIIDPDKMDKIGDAAQGVVQQLLCL